jgi:hypothetical protein
MVGTGFERNNTGRASWIVTFLECLNLGVILAEFAVTTLAYYHVIA